MVKQISERVAATRNAGNLDKRWLMLVLVMGALLIYLVGALNSPYHYSDPAFVVYYFATEIRVLGYLLLVTFIFLPAGCIGLGRPALTQPLLLLPFALWLLGALCVWVWAFASLPTVAPDNDTGPWLILRTTMVVGMTEEWIFRGLVFASLARWIGLRRGAYVALAAFGAFHLMNIVAGMPVAGAVVQAVLAFMSGAILLLAAACTRSLWLPMIGHGIYDFVVFDIVRMTQNVEAPLPFSLFIMANGIVLAILSLVWIKRLSGDEPYAESRR